MSFGEAHNPAYIGEQAIAPAESPRSTEVDANRLIQRRAFLELLKAPGAIVNLGIGIPSGLAALARALRHSNFTLTIESGVIGGVAADELSFGAAANPEAVLDQAAQFDFYSGGGLDLSFLGMLELDVRGNINVGKLRNRGRHACVLFRKAHQLRVPGGAERALHRDQPSGNGLGGAKPHLLHCLSTARR